MESPLFTITEKNGETRLIINVDILDIRAAAQCSRDVPLSLGNYRGDRLVIDVSGLAEIDSSGVAFLYSLKRNYGDRFTEIVVACSNTNIISLMELFGLHRHVAITAA